MSDDPQPHIEVMHSFDARNSGASDVVSLYDCDKGPLALPAHIKIGGLTWDRCKIESYSDQVDEYDVWLEDQIKAQNLEVMGALEEIFIKAQGVGVILTTICMPAPYVTHAHKVKYMIDKLASQGE